jgi:hypothetical protein
MNQNIKPLLIFRILAVTFLLANISITHAQYAPAPPAEYPITVSNGVDNAQIIDMTWNSNLRVIEVWFDKFPSQWGNWKMFLNNQEVPMEGGAGNAVVRPTSPLDESPAGLFIGSRPWLSSLDTVNFPCSGSIQFFIPDMGYTNKFKFYLNDCKTASDDTTNIESGSSIREKLDIGATTGSIYIRSDPPNAEIYIWDKRENTWINSGYTTPRGLILQGSSKLVLKNNYVLLRIPKNSTKFT